LSALAGSLVATSAFAGEMAVSGSAKLTYTDKEDGSLTGSQFGMNKLLGFTGSGEMDSGHTVTAYFGNNGTSQSSASLTYDMGDAGTIVFDQGAGGNGIGGIDDMTPTANEEIWDNISHGTGHDGFRTGIGNSGNIGYSKTLGTATVNVDYVRQGGGVVEDGATGLAGSGSSKSIAVKLAPADGMGVGFGLADLGSGNVSEDQSQSTAYITYAVGSVSLGAQVASEGGQKDTAQWHTTQVGVSFNVNDNMAIGYGQRKVSFGSDSTLPDQQDSGVSASYTMGSMSVTANMNRTDDLKGTAGSDPETTEIAVSFAF
jgi:outer membrane protein OmpU